ncbi:hypothetical protein EVU96_24795 [Bacillus infantis]|nr:hypothetical protein EVU96_24795 [Bacillus infantis]
MPEFVKVAGIDYVVEFEDYIEIDGSRNYQGVCRFRDAKIGILDSLSSTRQEQIFCHELTHAILNECGFDEQDEDMVNRFSIVLYQVLKDNKLHFGN